MTHEFAKQFYKMVDWWARRNYGGIGFIGSPNGMTSGQSSLLREVLEVSVHYVPIIQLHHCDRLGADVEAHEIATATRGVVTVSHPHTDAFYRARLASHEVRPAWPALRATLDVVEETELIIAAPYFGNEADKWDMVEEARKRRKSVLIIAPEIFNLQPRA